MANYTVINFEQIGKKTALAIPVLRYAVSIQYSSASIEILDHTIQSMLQVCAGNIEKASDMLCLEQELVQFIANSLQYRGILDSNYLSSGSEADSVVKVEVKTVYVYREMISGELLPYFSFENYQKKKEGTLKENILTTEIGSKGKSKKMTCKVLGIDSLKSQYSTPLEKEVRSIIDRTLKSTSQEDKFQHAPLTISDSPEIQLLLCNTLVSDSNNVYVTNSFNGKESMLFTNLLKRDSNLYTDILNSFVILDLTNDDSNNTHEDNQESNNINKTMQQLYQNMDKISQFMASDDHGSAIINKNRENYCDIFSKMMYVYEDTLKANLQGKYPCPKQTLSTLQDDTFEVVSTIIRSLVGKCPNELRRFLGASRQSLNLRIVDKLSLDKLCIFTILSTTHYDKHPFIYCIKDNPNIFLDMLEVKRIRDSKEHGNYDNIKISVDFGRKQLRVLDEFLKFLDPLYLSELPKDGSSEISTEWEKIQQESLKAEIGLVSQLSGTCIDKIRYTDVYRLCLEIEKKELDRDSRKMINEIYNALSCAMNIRYSPLVEENPDADKILKQLIELHPNLPKTLTTSEEQNRKKALLGQNSTLGATTLAYLYYLVEIPEHNESIPKFLQVAPIIVVDDEFIQFVCEVVELRGHGNSSSDIETVIRIKKQFYRYLSTII